MIAFNFSRPKQPAFLRALFAVRISAALKLPLAAVCFSLFVVFVAYRVEAYRLHASVGVESTYRERLRRSELSVAQLKIRFTRLQERAELDRRLHDIQASGLAESLRLADVANRLPSDTWLHTISRQAQGITLEGEARDLRAVSAAIDQLARARRVRNPMLLSADSASAEPRASGGVKFQLKLESAK